MRILRDEQIHAEYNLGLFQIVCRRGAFSPFVCISLMDLPVVGMLPNA